MMTFEPSNPKLDEQYQYILSLFEAEERVSGEHSFQERKAYRDLLSREIAGLASAHIHLMNRLRRLPTLPPPDLVEWAEAALQMQNLSFLVLETTGVNDDADILRVLIADSDGETRFDRLVRPVRWQYANSAYTGLVQEEIDNSPLLSESWPEIRKALTGRYVLAFNLPFVQERLRENAHHHNLPPITLIGADLQFQAQQYWMTTYTPKLITLCKTLGLSLPSPAPAPDRARGQLAILRAMSLGITSIHTHDEAREAEPEPTDPLGDLEEITLDDEHPF